MLSGKGSEDLVLLGSSLEATVTDLGGGIDELKINFLGLPGLGGGEDRLADNEGSLAGSLNATLKEEEVVTFSRVVHKQLQAVSQQFKEAKPEIQVWHVLDRQFDGAPLFEYIKYDLDDTFVIRLKSSRNSNEKSLNQQAEREKQ